MMRHHSEAVLVATPGLQPGLKPGQNSRQKPDQKPGLKFGACARPAKQ